MKLTIPMLYAIIAVMGLGLVDSYFISFLGTEQLAAIALIMPITAIVTSIGLGLGMAISSLNSKLIGANEMSGAARLITDGFYLTALVSALTVGVLIWQFDTIFLAIGADQTTLPHIKAYMRVWVYAAPFIMLSLVCASTFRSMGDTKASARISVSMTLANLILDPILIFGWGPIPAMGMAGAALATCIATVLSCSLGVYQLGVKEKFLLIALPGWSSFKRHIAELVDIAIPAVLANTINPLTAAIIIRLVAEFGNDAVAGYGVGTRIEAVSLMLVYALSSTLPMFIGQNLGAGQLDRVHQASSLAFRFVLILQVGVYLILAALAPFIAAAFSDQIGVQHTICLYLWIVPLSYGLSGIVVLTNVAMNVLGKPRWALYINILRLALFYFPLAWLGAKLYGLIGLFIGIAIGNVLAWLLARQLLRKAFVEMGIEAPSLWPSKKTTV